ncbi:MAG: hypothetical protein A2W82_03550 [Sulfurimonas sp. RIFCSPLOWO2_12_36_12]|uniref:CHAD domain-containing protein n=1 Tax=Sulfurimonas sp. RIFCSPLOWO2_12_36_12 TaxID=1802253 RepID=UPI0008D42A90|nr:CHAD domain-containing protein [Sulfurimonas sp. RIFCSPLOWO2_12_36_12]OHD98156.1 MAG: hypothetical protein A3J26_05930 [Sulfurimonas sp. RIFCSPLOWO2_02_FULL_36_28]OHE00326.1 MAG: hypothetical protein A2W82_03550 [Sulfurimonas sp. RIFCSPLOWO2_12_36_12]
MEKKSIAKKLQEFKKFIKYFTKNSLENTEDIHSLRIKCRELFSLLCKDEDLAKKIKKIISLSNGIRDIDVFFGDYLASLPEKYSKKIDKEVFIKDKSRKKEIKRLHKYLKTLEIPKSALQREEGVSPNLVHMELPELEQKKLHKYRIYIKKRLYIEKNSLERDNEKIKILTNVKDILGAINDNCNGLERLRSYNIKLSLYKKIKNFTQEQNKKLYEEAKRVKL